MMKYIIGLGSCQHTAPFYIARANDLFQTCSGVSFLATSNIYRNPPSQTPFQGAFYNAATAISTNLHPHALWLILKRIEQQLGRLRAYPKGPRTIDLDILLCLQFSFHSSTIILPHVDFHLRAFFVQPTLDVLQQAQWPIPLFVHKSRVALAQGRLAPLAPPGAEKKLL